MFKLILSALFAISLSCSHKSSLGEDTVDGSSNIQSSAVNFSAHGSDSRKFKGLHTVPFDFDSSSLNARAKELLKQNKSWLNNNSRFKFQIEGHCDAKGSVEYNLSLGERRAKSVQTYLINLGVPKKNLDILSYGKEKLLVDGHSSAADSRNRRANFVPIKK
ncbi:MAG: OmpA family protein [Bdellovibrionaceae bacterium]|nr:OmpA family protein [Pseudobdellovibrionaceae bacterium]